MAADATEAIRWYHTIELPDGSVTPGEYDLRRTLTRIPFPSTLAGKRCLDVGTRDGFFAFAMEKRGADEVVAIDIDDIDQLDWPLPKPDFPEKERRDFAAHEAFHAAHRALGSRVQLRNNSVYALDPAVVGQFDFAFLGTLLHHLRDPIGALTAIRRVVRGEFLVCASISLSLTVRRPRKPVAELADINGPYWWLPNRAALLRSFRASGFEVVDKGGPFLERYGAGWIHRPLRLTNVRELPRQMLLRVGAPHMWIAAR